MTKPKAKVLLTHPRYEGAALYSLAAAVRGFDDYSAHASTLKASVTARIRVILFGKVDGIMGSVNDTKMSPGEYRAAIKAVKNWKGNTHFIGHLQEAVEACEGHRLWGGHGKKLSKALWDRY